MNFSQSNSLLVLLFGVFLAGFMGSWHCAFMCGPIACFLAEQKKLWSYQVGRWGSYTLAGALSGYFMQIISNSFVWLKYVSVFGLALFLICMAFANSKLIFIPSFMSRWYFKARQTSFLLGLFSLFLPCGWLYTFIIAAGASRSVLGGALVMSVFWLSTLPVLTVSQIFLKKLIQKTDQKTQLVSRYVLLFASLYSLATFLFLH